MKPKKRSIDDEIDHIVGALEHLEVSSPEYKAAAENLKTLYEARSHKKASWISMDTIIPVVANLTGLGLILGQEHLHVINWKAIGQLIRITL